MTALVETLLIICVLGQEEEGEREIEIQRWSGGDRMRDRNRARVGRQY